MSESVFSKSTLLIFLSFVLLASTISCTKSGALTGNGSSGGAFSGNLSGNVNGGLSPVSGGTAALYAFGNSTPLAAATTTSSGAFTISYTNPGGQSALYLIVTGGNAGGGTNSNIQLAALLGQVSNVPASIVVNELTTAAFMNTIFNYGAVRDSNGAITFPAVNSAANANMMTQYNKLTANGAANSSLSTANQNALAAAANSIAACVENSANCATLFNNAINLSQLAAVSIQDALYNMVNTAPAPVNLTNLYKLANTVTGTTGFLMPGSNATSLNIQPIVNTQTFTAGSIPLAIAIDSSGNAWVTTKTNNSVTELSSSGTILGTFTVGTSPLGIAIDASGNAWVANFGGTTVTELSPSGTTLGTITVGTNPFSIAIDASGNIWVTNEGSANVTELSSSGATLGTFTVGSQPLGMAIDASRNVWVVNRNSNTVTELSSSGTTLRTVAVGSTSYGIAIDPSQNIWLGNAANSTITKLSSSGVTLNTFTTGAGTQPRWFAIDPLGNVFVDNAVGTTVTKLSSLGTTLGTFTTGTGPYEMAIDASGNIWIANFGNGGASTTVTQIQGATLGPEFFPYSGPVWP